MLSYRQYTLWLLAFISIKILIPSLTLLYLQPISGDIIKYGFSENDYGWTKPQKYLLNTPTGTLETYENYSDVVVFGDSFSHFGTPQGLNSPWQTLFSALTGFSVKTFNLYKKDVFPLEHDNKTIQELIQSKQFKETPPKIFIYETVERHLQLLADVGGSCIPDSKIQAIDFSKVKPIPSLSSYREVSRLQSPPIRLIELSFIQKLDYARNYLYNKSGFNILKSNFAHEQLLLNPALFSNKKSDSLLFANLDLIKARWYEKEIGRIRCKLINLQNLVQSNGKTLFIIMIVPDKLTVYSPFIKDQNLAKISLLNQLYANSREVHFVKLNHGFDAMLKSGVIDLYLPNDTHWGYLGHQAAADMLFKYLQDFKGDIF